jgi:hypothetical protein
MSYVKYRKIDRRATPDRLSGDKSNGINIKGKENFMETHLNMENRLWDYIDGLSAPAEHTAIEKLIGTDPHWTKKYQELLNIHQLMQQTGLEDPSMRFTKNVMEEIARYQVAPATRSYLNKKIIGGIGGFFIIVISGFLVYFFSQLHLFSGESPKILNDYGTAVNKVEWSRVLNSTSTNLFMCINIVLGLVMLDMYLMRKKQRHRKAL